MIWLGGDHSITLSLLRAYRAHYGRPLAMLHFDAHCDTWSSHFDEPSGHGTWVYEALQEELIDPKLSVQLGIRSARCAGDRQLRGRPRRMHLHRPRPARPRQRGATRAGARAVVRGCASRAPRRCT